jgi:hypothetical protein
MRVMSVIAKPAADEYVPYYGTYIGRVPESDLAEVLQQQIDATRALLRNVAESRAGFRYAEGKWSIREVIGHLVDVERVMSYRLLWAARADPAPLPGFDENTWVPASDADRRTLTDLSAEFGAVRGATIALFRGLPAEGWTRRTTANAHPISARALAYIIAGHERHHLEVLRQRYAVGV